MILGEICTRHCGYCAVRSGVPGAPDPREPENVARAVRKLNLRHAVITSVTRDDLPDGGAGQFSKTVKAVKAFNEGATVEVLIPDFRGDWNALEVVVQAAPEIINHNIETVERLYTKVRPQARYFRSLDLLRKTRGLNPQIITKSGFMVGLGEREEEVLELMQDLKSAGCDILTIGQYLRPSKNHLDIAEYVSPDQFDRYRDFGIRMGFKHVFSAPLVRSSYHASEMMDSLYLKSRMSAK